VPHGADSGSRVLGNTVIGTKFPRDRPYEGLLLVRVMLKTGAGSRLRPASA
jgi:hypothetical protein